MKIPIGSKIKDYRLKMNISQKELCGEFFNRTTLSKIETNKMLPSIPQLEYIADKLDLLVANFFVDEDYTQLIEKSTTSHLDIIGEMFQENDFYSIVKLIEFENISVNSKNFMINYYIGMSFFNLRMNKNAVNYLKKYIRFFMKSSEEIKNEQVINFAIASNTLFKIALKSRNFEKCKSYLLASRKYLYQYDKQVSYINFVVNSNLAFVYNQTHDFEKTIELLEFFLSSNKTLAYMEIMPDLHLSLNIAYYNTGQYDKSIEHIKKSIFFYSYIGNNQQERSCYLNFTNALRYNKDFEKALSIVTSCITNYSDDKLYDQFIVQKAIIYFNMKDYASCLNTFKVLKLSKFSTPSKNNYYFMKGHIEFSDKDYNLALKDLLRCENYFIVKNYFKDLVCLYEDLYVITKKEQYKNKALENVKLSGRRNIL